MFYRLISNLNYSPGLISQVSFYAKRLHREEFVRRVGLIFTLLALTLQTFLVLSPPTPSLASSSNDVIYGGGDKAKVLNSYRTNRDDLGRTDIQAIFNRFGIGEAELAATRDVVIQSRAENNFHSIGRHKRFSSQIEHQVDVPGANPVFIRPLHAWDSGAYSTYQALYGVNNQGKEFWILKNCGNIVIKESEPDPLPPDLQITKSIARPAKSTVKRGEVIEYILRYRNTGPGNAVFMRVEDQVPKYTSFQSHSGPFKHIKNGLAHWNHLDEKNNPFAVLGVTSYYHEARMVVKVNNDAPYGTRICNTAFIEALGHPRTPSNAVCRTVEKPEEPKPQAAAVCSVLTVEKNSRNVYTFSSEGVVENGASIRKFNFTFGDGQSASIDPGGSNMASVEHIYQNPGEYTVSVTLDSSEGNITDPNCAQSIIVEEPAGEPMITHAKKVKNITQEIEDANGTLAKAGDRLEYRLITENFGDADAGETELPQEDISDVLEYADIIELNDAIHDTDRNVLTWPKVSIDAGGKVEKVFVVQVKDPIPQTPVSASDPGSFDLIMSNSYGADEVNIKLPPSNNKRIEIVSKELPNTGISANIISSTFLIGMSTYFYSRNRLISKELKLVKKEFSSV